MKKLIVCSFAVFTLLYALCPMLSFPGVPGKLNYQGKLTDNQGNLITGTRDINFALYTDAVSSFAVWTEGHATVTVTNSLFNVVLGESKDLSSIFEDYDSLYLEIEVAGETLLPRQEMASAGYALQAQSTYQDAAYPMETYVVKAGGTPGVDCDFTTLSEAIVATGSGNGSIFVKDGTYIEDIVINGVQNVIIKGESHNAIIRNSGASHTISLDGECINVLIRDLRIEVADTGYSAIYIISGDCNRITISNCEIISTSSGTAYGINTSATMSSANILNNRFESESEKGIGIYGIFAYSLLQGNRFVNWDTGISLEGSNYNIIDSNRLWSTGAPGSIGFSLRSWSGDNVVSDNMIEGPETGIFLFRAINNVIDSNKFISLGFSGSTGFSLQTSSDGNVLSNNSIKGPEAGILLADASNNLIEGNYLRPILDFGVYITGLCYNNSVFNNRIYIDDSGFNVGIYADGTGGQTLISGNNIRVQEEGNKHIYSGDWYNSIVGNWTWSQDTDNIGIEINASYNLVSGNYNYQRNAGNALKESGGTANVYQANFNNDTN